MEENILTFGIVNAIFGWTDGEVFFALCLCIAFVGFILCLTFAVFAAGYSLKKRLWFLLLSAAVCALLKARAELCAEKDFSLLLAAAVFCFSVPLFCVRVKKSPPASETDTASRNLVRFIDENMRRTDCSPPVARAESGVSGYNAKAKYPPEREFFSDKDVITAAPAPAEKSSELDFSHVKNVLSRMESFALSTADRQKIRELEFLIMRAERGEEREVKRKLNEGLNNLLKIMAKHGV